MVINKSPQQEAVHLTLLNGPVPPERKTLDPNVLCSQISDRAQSYKEARVNFFEGQPGYGRLTMPPYSVRCYVFPKNMNIQKHN